LIGGRRYDWRLVVWLLVLFGVELYEEGLP
jgi:hypothetical protein